MVIARSPFPIGSSESLASPVQHPPDCSSAPAGPPTRRRSGAFDHRRGSAIHPWPVGGGQHARHPPARSLAPGDPEEATGGGKKRGSAKRPTTMCKKMVGHGFCAPMSRSDFMPLEDSQIKLLDKLVSSTLECSKDSSSKRPAPSLLL